MTTQAEAASAATALSPHVAKNAASGMHADTPLLAQALGTLTSIGSGGPGASTQLHALFAAAVSRCSARAAAAGDFTSAESLKTCAAVLNNLSLGL